MSSSHSVERNGRGRRAWASVLLSLFFRTGVIALLASSWVSCAFFYRQPELPKRAAIESGETPQADEKFTALVQSADIIYFPSELLEAPSRSAPVSKLVNALRHDGSSFAVGWDMISGKEQPLLDQWAKRDLSTASLISRLHLSGSDRERENCRALLNVSKEWGARLLALRCPSDSWAARGADGVAGGLAPAETAMGFHLRSDDLRRFAEHFPAAGGMDEKELRAAYGKALRAETFAAERVIEYFRRHRDEKLLVFVHRRHFENARGVPYFVAQRIVARQLVLDLQPRPRGPGLFARSNHRGILRRVEIIDGSPGAGRDQL